MPRYSERTGQLQTYQVGPYSAVHRYLQFGGALPGNESWSCGMRFTNTGAGTEADLAQHLINAGGAVVEWFVDPTSGIGNNATIEFVKLNTIGTNGQYASAGTSELTYEGSAGGAAGAGSYPNQIALVVTLTTGFTRGPAHAGRVYLPMPYTTVGSDGRIPATGNASAEQYENTFSTLISELNASSPNWVLSVMSRKAGAPASRPITGCKVGRVLDTQRRRRRSLLEEHVD